jgi:hypothetical protein
MLAVVLGGCSGSQKAELAEARQIQNNPQLKKPVTARLAGQVTVDGHPPSTDSRLFVILNDPQKPRDFAKGHPLYARCDSLGNFAFGNVLKRDVVPIGSYVVTFVQLHPETRRTIGPAAFGPPDELKNLWSDPQNNARVPAFVLNVAPPGKTDYRFDLRVAGKEPLAAPGGQAVTRIVDRN